MQFEHDTCREALRKVGDQYALPVYLLDNSFKTILIASSACVGDVVNESVMRIGLKDAEKLVPCFCIVDCKDGVTLSRPLRMSDPIAAIMKEWPKDGDKLAGKFVFRVKLFTPSLTRSLDKQAQYLLYIDAVYNVIAGLYPVQADEAISLAALQMQAKYGNHKDDTHRVGYLTSALRGMVPAPLLPGRPSNEWESAILGRHGLLNQDAQGRPVTLYCAVLAVREWYGCAMFTVKQSFSKLLPAVLMLGLNGSGIFFLEKSSKVTLEKHYLHALYKWGYIPEKTDGSGCKGFYFQVKNVNGTTGAVYEFTTSQGEVMSGLLTDYAQKILEEILEAQAQAAASAADDAAKAKAQASKVAAVASAARSSGVAATGGAPAGGPATISPSTRNTVAAATSPAGPKRNAAENAKLAEGAAAAKLAGLFSVKGKPAIHSEQARTWAAVKIQTAARGLLSRCAFDRMIAALEEELRSKGKLN